MSLKHQAFKAFLSDIDDQVRTLQAENSDFTILTVSQYIRDHLAIAGFTISVQIDNDQQAEKERRKPGV